MRAEESWLIAGCVLASPHMPPWVAGFVAFGCVVVCIYIYLNRKRK